MGELPQPDVCCQRDERGVRRLVNAVGFCGGPPKISTRGLAAVAKWRLTRAEQSYR